MITIKTISRPLSDRSVVHDVHLSDDTGAIIILPAVTHVDAIDLMARIANAVTAHTNEDVRREG